MGLFLQRSGKCGSAVNARWVEYRGFLFKFLVVIVFFCECLEGSRACGDGRPMDHFNFLVVFVFVFFCICFLLYLLYRGPGNVVVDVQ